MTNTTPLSGLAATPSATAANGSDRARLHKAAQEFEAMFLRQILSSARTSTQGSEALFGHKPDDTFTQMRDENFARIMAQSGKLGLAARLEAQLASHLATTAANAASPLSSPRPSSSAAKG